MRKTRSRLEQVARSYMEFAKLQYINRVISYPDVPDTQTGLNNAVRDKLLSVVNLYSALEGRWENK